MAEATKTVEMAVNRDKLCKIIGDYEKYPEFVDGANRARVLKRDGKVVRIEYAIELLGKAITYTLDHHENWPDGMKWEIVESNILKGNSGYWKLKSLGPDRTEVTYSLALDFKIYVPGMILSGLVKSTLPKMLESFEKRTKLKG